MSYQNIAKAKAIEKKNKERLLEVNPKLDDNSGIYFLTREDENGFKFAYIGQAKHLLTRLAQHLVVEKRNPPHIDCSLRKHGLYTTENQFGWKVNFIHYSEIILDEVEKKWIKEYALKGYQVRNKTAGGQGEGKAQISEYRPSKGYRDGVQQGRKALARELKHIIDKHLIVSLKPEKSANKVSQNALEKFNYLLDEKSYESEDSVE